MDISFLKDTENYVLAGLGVAATTSLVARVLIVVLLDDVIQIIRKYREAKREKSNDSK
jgi:predicted RND superfamily exporter protein